MGKRRKTVPPIDWVVIEAALARSFTGHPRDGDFELCRRAHAEDPERYRELGHRVREEKRNELRSMFRTMKK